MKQSIIISISPKWVAKILNGEKKLEIRKSIPKCDLPIDVYIYCTKEKDKNLYMSMFHGNYQVAKNVDHKHHIINGKVVAKFTLYETEEIKWENCPFHEHWEYATESMWEEHILDNSGLSFMELHDYLCNHKGYVWYIEKLEIFDKPKELKDFCVYSHSVNGVGINGENKTFEILKPLAKAPQSWCYIRDLA